MSVDALVRGSSPRSACSLSMSPKRSTDVFTILQRGAGFASSHGRGGAGGRERHWAAGGGDGGASSHPSSPTDVGLLKPPPTISSLVGAD